MRNLHTSDRQPERGFSLAETLVVVALTGIVGVTLWGAVASFYKKNAYIYEAAASVDIAHRGLEIGLRDLREASYGADGAYPVATIGTSTVTFYADTNNNGIVERVRFSLSNGALVRADMLPAGSPPSYAGQPSSTSTIANYVRNATSTPIFRYYDSSGMEVATNTRAVASVTIRIDVDLNPYRAPAISTMSGSATLRNLRDD